MKKLTKRFLLASALFYSAGMLSGCSTVEGRENSAIDKRAEKIFTDWGYEAHGRKAASVEIFPSQKTNSVTVAENGDKVICYNLTHKATQHKTTGCISDKTGKFEKILSVKIN